MPDLTPEQRAREQIDAMLRASGWEVQSKDAVNLRDDGLSYGDFVEQLTLLLFLKMADEALARGHRNPPFNKPSRIPNGKDWSALLAKDGDELEIHYRHTLEELGKRSGMLGVIFRKAQNKIAPVTSAPSAVKSHA